MELAGALLALAFPDRIGQRRAGGDGRYLLANGRGAAFAGAVSLAREEFIVAVELDDREREARIDLAAPLTARSCWSSCSPARIVTRGAVRLGRARSRGAARGACAVWMRWCSKSTQRAGRRR